MTSFTRKEWLSSQQTGLSFARVAFLLIALALSPSAFASFVLHETVSGGGTTLAITHGSTITRTYLDVDELAFITSLGTDGTPFTTSVVSSDTSVFEPLFPIPTIPGSPYSTLNGMQFKSAGTATVTFTRRRNSDTAVLEQATVTFVIQPSRLTIQANDQTRFYGMPNPFFNGTVHGLPQFFPAFSTNPTYSTIAGPNSPVGVYPITVSGAVTYPRYVLDPSINGTLFVTAAPLTITVGDAGRTYGSANPPFSATFTGLAPGETGANALVTPPVLATSATPNSPVGPYPITATGASTNANYLLQPPVNGTLTVGPAPLTMTVANASRAYGNPNPPFNTTFTGLAPGETGAIALVTQPALATLAVANSPVGPYPITAAGAVANANYVLQTVVNGSLTVTPRPLTVGAQNASRPYGSPNPPFTVVYGSFAPGETSANAFTTLPTLISYTDLNTTPGTYPISIQGAVANANYSLQSPTSGILTVERAPLTVTVQDATRLYGAPDPVFNATYTGLVLGQTSAVALTTLPTLSTNATPASPTGNYPITATGAVTNANYSWQTPVSGTLTVGPAPLTMTVDNVSRIYGAPNPVFSATYGGLVLGETAADALTSLPTLGTSATASSATGTYPITVSGAASNANYLLQAPVEGVLTVAPAPLVVTAANATRVYGSADPPFSATYTGLVPGETSTNALTTPPTLGTSATAASAVGTYPITASGAVSNANYLLGTPVDGALTVTPAPLVVTAENASRVAGAANPVFTALTSGWVNGESDANLVTPPVFSTTATSDSPPGTYPIIASDAAASNYEVSFVDGTLTITAAPVVVTPTPVPVNSGWLLGSLCALLGGLAWRAKRAKS
ncbi:MBG domain-containing protein [Ottowia thiooxydans]|uniref:MBG domain-containing protein n=1 Tax=Ottowia thiooxydans TaxID=219182 RepID=UPI0004145A96|nr:MBG domain-containing protein [Ottowia thiooxydans]